MHGQNHIKREKEFVKFMIRNPNSSPLVFLLILLVEISIRQEILSPSSLHDAYA